MTHTTNHERRNKHRVSVASNARLHLGFLDISGALGRRFGSLGLSIDAFTTRLRVSRSPACTAYGPGAERAQTYAQQVLDHLDISSGVEIVIEQSIPNHLGLGSGTQMALAVGRAIALLYDREFGTREVAGLLNRGARSGIGIGAFDQGGFLIDSGVDNDGQVPPVIARYDYPEDWRVLLVLDARGKGLHGRAEAEAFRQLPAFPQDRAAHLCHLTLMQILPALNERKFDPVAEGIAELQRAVGDHFAPAQGGRYTSPAVASALEWAECQGYRGVGQSSWGPTGFILAPSQASVEELKQRLIKQFVGLSPLRFVVCNASNHGSNLQFERPLDALREVN